MTDRLPPHTIAAEEAVTGSLLIDGEAIHQIPALTPGHFYHGPTRDIYTACLALKDRHEAINQVTVAQELDRRGKLDSVGGVAYLSHLVSILGTSLDVQDYALEVSNAALARRMVAVGQEIANIGYGNPADVPAAIARCDSLVAGLRKGMMPERVLMPGPRSDQLREHFIYLKDRDSIAAKPGGIPKLDRFLGGGFFDGDLVIVAGRPSMGKTTLLSFFAHQLTMQGTVLFCSAEMTSYGLAYRDIARRLGVPINTIRQGRYSEDLYDQILGAVAQMGEGRMVVYSESPMTTSRILQTAVTLQGTTDLTAICIDYLGLLADEYGHGLNERTSYISRRCKEMAVRLNLPVLLACQLNRDVTKRDEKRPLLQDLRDSGAIEQDADVVLFVHRPHYYDADPADRNDPAVEIIVGKQRQGDTGLFECQYANQGYE